MIQSVKEGNLTATVAQDSANIGVTALKGFVAAYPASSFTEKTPVSAVLVSGK